MSERNFKKDLELVLSTQKGGTELNNIKFPLFFEEGFMERNIESFVTDQRGFNSLKRNNVGTIAEFVDKFDELGELRNVGVRTVRMLKQGFLQYWYSTLTQSEVKAFWQSFCKENGIE